MAVYVYKTGKIPVPAGEGVQIAVTTMNDDTQANTYRIIVWNAPSGALKTVENDTGVLNIAANNSANNSHFINPGDVTEFGVEVRYSSPNMVPRIVYAIDGVQFHNEAGELFSASTQTENP